MYVKFVCFPRDCGSEILAFRDEAHQICKLEQVDQVTHLKFPLFGQRKKSSFCNSKIPCSTYPYED